MDRECCRAMKAPDTTGYFVSIHRETFSTLQLQKTIKISAIMVISCTSGTSVDLDRQLKLSVGHPTDGGVVHFSSLLYISL